MTTVKRRMRSTNVTLSVTALVAATLSGCAGGADNQAICVDPETEVRVDDDECDDVDEDYNGVGGGFYWFYIPVGNTAPRVGGVVPRGVGTYSSTGLSGTVKKGGVPASGGTISRGGFGGGLKSGS